MKTFVRKEEHVFTTDLEIRNLVIILNIVKKFNDHLI
jgi:hypothetical protein